MRDVLLALLKAVTVIFVMGPLLTFEYGWVVSVLWSWFATPLGAPALTVVYATGLVLIIRTATYRYRWAPDFANQRSALAQAVVVPLFALGSGLVIKQFM